MIRAEGNTAIGSNQRHHTVLIGYKEFAENGVQFISDIKAQA